MTNNDLISRAYVLAEYDRQHKGPPGGARKIMEEAPAVDAVPVARQWISVNDRLPETEGTYIVMTEKSWEHKPYKVMAMDFEIKVLRGVEKRRWKWYGKLPIWSVTHWMPLPEPPKMDGDA